MRLPCMSGRVGSMWIPSDCNEEVMRKYIQDQDEKDKRLDQLDMFKGDQNKRQTSKQDQEHHEE